MRPHIHGEIWKIIPMLLVMFRYPMLHYNFCQKQDKFSQVVQEFFKFSPNMTILATKHVFSIMQIVFFTFSGCFLSQIKGGLSMYLAKIMYT